MISMKNVTKSFQGRVRPVIHDLSLSIARGEFCVLIGSNGCGKSTLLKLISGAYKADSGTIERQGEVAQVTQDIHGGTVGDMTLLENAALSEGSRRKGMFYKRHKASLIQKLRTLDHGLEALIDEPLKNFSGGQRQMIATFMAFNTQKPLLLLDEHTSALDPQMQKKLMAYTHQQVLARGLTTVMITHKMEDALLYGHRLMMLHQGKVVLDVKDREKHALKMQDLLDLFYHYEKHS